MVVLKISGCDIIPDRGAELPSGAGLLAPGREQQIGGSGGSLEPPGPLLTHLRTVCMAYSERLSTRLNPLAEGTCFSQAPGHQGCRARRIKPGAGAAAGMLTFSATIQSPYNLQSTTDGSSTSIALVGRDANSGGPGGSPGPLGLAIA
jgi:hypothetical protein